MSGQQYDPEDWEDIGSLEPQFYRFHTSDGRRFILREPTEGVSMAYKDASSRSLVLKGGETVGTKGSSAADLALLCKCLSEFDRSNGMAEKPVSERELVNWPTKLTLNLLMRLKRMAGFVEEETEEELVKQIAERQKKLDAIRAKNRPEVDTNGDGAAGQGDDESGEGGEGNLQGSPAKGSPVTPA